MPLECAVRMGFNSMGKMNVSFNSAVKIQILNSAVRKGMWFNSMGK